MRPGELPASITRRFRRANLRLWPTVLLALTLTASAASPTKLISQRAPDFVLRSIDGENVRLSEHLGEVVLVNFWASWCGPCRQEMPKLDELNAKYHRAGLLLVGVNVDEEAPKALEMAQAMKVGYPLLMDPHKDIVRAYQVTSLPATIIIDREGVVRYVNEGYKPGTEKQYQNELHKLLNEQ